MRWFILSVVVVAVAVLSQTAYFNPYDDSDPPGGRSGLRIYTDHKTGLQYLGCVTPRLTADGAHMRETAP